MGFTRLGAEVQRSTGRGSRGRRRPGASIGRRCHGFPFVQSRSSAVGPPSAGAAARPASAGRGRGRRADRTGRRLRVIAGMSV
ncbi:hypothetical protein STTU_0710 [Streptomyces sp. Tu6071]|nr:hypothetical protein STTU_0710 [Streptomyces sp. Tu6071]